MSVRNQTFLFVTFLLTLLASESALALSSNERLMPVPMDDQFAASTGLEEDLLRNPEIIAAGIDHNLRFLKSGTADSIYRRFARGGITKERVESSLLRFREILLSSSSTFEMHQRIKDEFLLYKTPGYDGRGSVKFTGYFQPVYRASRTPTSEFRFPIYRMPASFKSWRHPHPTRITLEGADGLGIASSPLAGHELAYLKSRYEVYMIQLQGSAVLEFATGERANIGFAAGTDYPFVGLTPAFLSGRRIKGRNFEEHSRAIPEDLNRYLARNNRVIFFQERVGAGPIGSLGAPVIAERSIATDKSKLPPGAIGLIRTSFPGSNLEQPKDSSRIVLDQDSGRAIRGLGRVDIYMGTGNAAHRKANAVTGDGELYYLLLK